VLKDVRPALIGMTGKTVVNVAPLELLSEPIDMPGEQYA